MLKVLIADDEIWVCKLIACTIDWENLGMELIGFVHDGEEGLAMIGEKQPDIVITDVRMPIMNGIELIENTRANDALESQPYFIVISGYQDFEYVQTALRQGASDYILKPYDEEQLAQALVGIREKIGLDTLRTQDEQSVRQQLSDSIGKLRETGLYSLYHGDRMLETLEDFNREFSFDFTIDHFHLFYVRVSSITGAAASRQLLGYIADHFAEYFERLNGCIAFSFIENGAAVITVNHALSLDNAVQDAAKSVFSILLGDKSINKQVMLSMGCSEKSTPVAGLSGSFHYARDCADCRLFSGYSRIYNLSQLSLVRLPKEKLLDDSARSAIVQAIESFDSKRLQEEIAALYKPLTDGNPHPRNLYELADLLIAQFCEISQKMNLAPDKLIPAEELLFPLELCTSMHDFAAILSRDLSDALSTYHAATREGPSKPVQMAIAIIEQQYSKSLRLGDVAKEVFLTPQYFSELFKAEMGINFSDYLANYRITAAKKLLVTPGEKIKDICVKVGYADAKSFSKLFKKSVGLTPREYRTMFS